jgi:imidazoleglycerol-phosphate dehydratase
MMREGKEARKTRETQVEVSICLDRIADPEIHTGVPFFDHMLTASAKHGDFYLRVQAEGDLQVDCHHLIEDTGIVLGTSIRQAIGDGRGIRRFAHAIVPMDESIALVSLDCGGRGYLVFHGSFKLDQLGGIPSDLFQHFFYGCCIHAGITAHIRFEGTNDHHACEAVFKAFGIALGKATSHKRGRTGVPSTKGTF